MEDNRATGRTTRLCNFYIEHLFENRGQWHTILDHWEHGAHEEANVDLRKKILKRLSFENPGSRVEYDQTKIRIMDGIIRLPGDTN